MNALKRELIAERIPPDAGLAAALPLAVDLDGTLIATDTLFECIAAHFRTRPIWTLIQMLMLPFAIARVKARLQRRVDIEPDLLPVNADVIEYCRSARAAGRPVWLVSAADQSIVDQVAERFGFFDRVIGSDGVTNNKGSAKARKLLEFLPQGFEYVGDSPADFKVWRSAKAASLVGGGGSRRRAVEGMGIPVLRQFARRQGTLRDWRKAMRLHQWAKNALIFAAPALALALGDPAVLIKCLIAFPLLGLVASGTYMINDLLDLQADRAHHSKKRRPFAAGRIKLWQGFVAAPALILTGFVGGALLSPMFAATLASYLVLTLSYSLFLKRKPLIDVMLLAFLYTLRLIMGAVLAGVAVTNWLLVFSMFLFTSLSLAKRHVEVVRKAAAGFSTVANRGYRAEDAGLTLALGVAAAVACPIILVLYLVETAGPASPFAQRAALWVAPAILSLWLMRVWLLANRNELDDDPVTFAVKDPYSLALGAGLMGAFLVAAFGGDGVVRAIGGLLPGSAP